MKQRVLVIATILILGMAVFCFASGVKKTPKLTEKPAPETAEKRKASGYPPESTTQLSMFPELR